MRRSLSDPAKVWDKVPDVLSTEEFMQSVTLKVGVLQDIWSRAAGVPGTQARAALIGILTYISEAAIVLYFVAQRPLPKGYSLFPWRHGRCRRREKILEAGLRVRPS
jgi:hypothetical protein